MRAFAVTLGWSIRYVHRHDVAHPNPRRPARVLLTRGGSGDWLLPLHGDTRQLFGLVLDERTRSSEAEEWILCDPEQPWVPGKIPVVQSKEPVGFEFIDPLEAERRRRREASEAILSAFSPKQADWSLLKRVSLLEHADRLLGGHVLSVGALLALHRQSGEQAAAEFGSLELLGDRLREAAPSGTASLQSVWMKPGFEEIRDATSLRGAITDAITQTFAARHTLAPGKWRSMRELTLWNWWVRARLASTRKTPRELARELAVPTQSLEALLHGEAPPDVHLRQHLPSEEVALEQLAEGARDSQAPYVIASVAEAHRPRLGLMASQLAELERLLGRTQRLSRWERVHHEMSEIATSVDPAHLGGLEDWQRAQLAAQDVRQLLREVKRTSLGEALPLGDLLEGAALRLLGATFPYERLQGEWALGSGAAPVIALSPSVVAGDIGVLRFAVAHQLGHLLESLGGHRTSICTCLEEGNVLQSGEGERFANAFAAYLLAPREDVQRVVGSHHRGAGWQWDAARDIARVFGMSPGAAMPHLLNCMGESSSRHLLEGIRNDPRWKEYREEARDSVEALWSNDRSQVLNEIGEQPRLELREALRRPRSVVFDELVSEAASEDLLDPELLEELRAA